MVRGHHNVNNCIEDGSIRKVEHTVLGRWRGLQIKVRKGGKLHKGQTSKCATHFPAITNSGPLYIQTCKALHLSSASQFTKQLYSTMVFMINL